MRNHVAVFHHADEHGVHWYLEGRPSGLGWRTFLHNHDLYLTSPYTVDNASQPKTPGERQLICATMLQMLGAPYDWEAIEGDAAEALHLPEVWQAWGHGTTMPGHVVCSSSAAWAYHRAGIPAPELGGGRFTEPGDWDAFIATQGWKRSAA
jgi:hypothetical protein